jgi:DNA-binding response OmpR family regulator
MVSLLTTLLTLEGFSVKTPANHHMEAVINTVLTERPDLALVDVNLRN